MAGAEDPRGRAADCYYGALVELSGHRPFVADQAGTILFVDPASPPPAAISFDTDETPAFFAAFHADDRDSLIAAWFRSVETGKRLAWEGRLVGHGGGGPPRWSRVQAIPLAGTGNSVRWFGTVEDIDQHRRLHDDAVAAEQRYRLASRATHDLIWDHDLPTDRLRLGEAITTVFGYTLPSEVVHLDWLLNLIHPDDRAEVARSYRAACAGTQHDALFEYRLRRMEGTYAHVSVCAFIVRDEQARAVRTVGALRDLSAQREAEQRLSDLQAELIRVSRDSAMGALASMLAHELNQPLTALIGYVRGSQRLLARGDHAAVQQSIAAMDAAVESALGAGAIVRRLRELVARGGSAAGIHDLAVLIEDACALALVDARKWNINWEVRPDPAARFVAADRVQIQQVLINLLRNAVEAMRGLPRRVLTIRTTAVGDHAEICIEDTGSGIPAGQQAVLFQPFSSTKPEGIGVGLSICRIIVEAGGGRIWLERSDETGTLLCFTVPLSDGRD